MFKNMRCRWIPLIQNRFNNTSRMRCLRIAGDNDPFTCISWWQELQFYGVELLGHFLKNRERYAEMAGVAPNQIQIMSVDGAKRPLSVFSASS